VGANKKTQEMVSGESHYFLGRRYRMTVTRHDGPETVLLRSAARMELCVRPESGCGQRQRVLQWWYREQLRALVRPLVAKWEPILGVQVAEWGIKKMKTRWGSCNGTAGRIWLNLELAKKPPQCLEYIVVHEMTHLLELRHNERFRAYLDKFMPQWRLYREELNQAPLRHDTWEY
jgi:predicted metal-dependent hydrolase